MDVIERLENQILDLKEQLSQKEKELQEAKKSSQQINNNGSTNNENENIKIENKIGFVNTLPKWAIERYSRQILLPDIGVEGQEKLMKAKILIIGAGGLGCPAAAYLAGAGVGEIGIVDYDEVEITNIHRQILHSECDQGISKSESAANSLKSINSRIKVTPYNLDLNPGNALDIASKYDLILDCTDNVPTRYMLNDVSVLAKIPLISGSALKMEGQLTIYGYREENSDKPTGPCYRCVFPTPPPAGTVGSCSAQGVAGPIPGVIGTLQALEAIKLIVGHTYKQLLVGRLLLFDGEDMTFRTVKLRSRNPQCDICSETPKITELLNYEVLCDSQAIEKDLELKILSKKHRINAKKMYEKIKNTHIIDVRNENEYKMCNLDGSTNFPIDKLHRNMSSILEQIRKCDKDVTFICRRGNDSQIVVQKVLEELEEGYKFKVTDLIGGLHAWSKYVDTDFPIY